MSKALVTKLVDSMQKRPTSWEVRGDRALQETADDIICVFDGTVTILESSRPFKIKYPVWTTRFEKRALRKAVAALKEKKLLLMLDTVPLVLVADSQSEDFEKAHPHLLEPVASFEQIQPPESLCVKDFVPDWACPEYLTHGALGKDCIECDANWLRRAGQLI